jgi:hypothetical protein
MDYEGWFKFAYITTELSYAINAIVVIIFWIILWPWVLSMTEGMEGPEVTYGLWYQGLIHSIPMITTVANLWMTDMALEKSHWWMSFIAMCPIYMVCNWYGAMNKGSLVVPGRIGDIYGFEYWDSNIPLTIFLFILAAGG